MASSLLHLFFLGAACIQGIFADTGAAISEESVEARRLMRSQQGPLRKVGQEAIVEIGARVAVDVDGVRQPQSPPDPKPEVLLETDEDEWHEQISSPANQVSASELNSDHFTECAVEGGNCSCPLGVVLFGNGPDTNHWAQVRVDNQVPCTQAVFGDPFPGADKACRCYKLDWCLANKKTLGIPKAMNDPAHRRRSTQGPDGTSITEGTELHQRRRWCGWGPRECQWGVWQAWSGCSHTCNGENGTKTRARIKEVWEANGGTCTGHNYEAVACAGSCPDGGPPVGGGGSSGGGSSGGGSSSNGAGSNPGGLPGVITMAGCPKQVAKAPEECNIASPTMLAYVRCCGPNGEQVSHNKYKDVKKCSGLMTHADATKYCTDNKPAAFPSGIRLCTASELTVTCGTGCGYNNKRVWTSSSCTPTGL